MSQYYIQFFYILKIIISKNNYRAKSEVNAYYLISLFQGFNLLSIYNIFKSINISLSALDSSFILYVVVFFAPPLLFNYFYFIRNERFIKLMKGDMIYKRVSKYFMAIVILYLSLTPLFFGISIYINL
ncbi:MAG: hypothetical protein FD181_3860 [Prolixibacteraceae bacterium]|nr:MAG: hypothetical protein FD181_3860 [Prolixibacteraceae bacterium]